MKKLYTHTQKERYYFFISLKSDKYLSYLSDKIGRSKSTVSRKIESNKGYRYKYDFFETVPFLHMHQK